MPTYRIKLAREGQANVEDWWARTGRPVPKAASTAEWIRNQLSFVTFELKQVGLPIPRPTSVATEFLVVDVPLHQLTQFASIIRYHGFDVIAEEET